MDPRSCAITRVLLRAGFLSDGLVLCGRDRLRGARLRVTFGRIVRMEVHPCRHGGTGDLVPLVTALCCRWIWQFLCGWLDRDVEQSSCLCQLARWSHSAPLVRTTQWSVRRDRDLVSFHSLLRRGRFGRRTSCFDRPVGGVGTWTEATNGSMDNPGFAACATTGQCSVSGVGSFAARSGAPGPGITGFPLPGVSCVSTAFCVAVTDDQLAVSAMDG